MHVCGVPGQQYTPAAVGGCLPRHVGEPGDPVGAAEPVVGAVHAHERLAATEAELWLLLHLDLGDHPAGRGIQPGEVDAGCLADQAASSVAADEVLRSERRVARQLDTEPIRAHPG